MRTSLAWVALAVVAPAILPAQTTASSAAFFLGGGIEAVGVGALYERAYGLSLEAGYVRQYSRLGVRLAATYFERNRLTSTGYARPRAVGATLELSYDVSSSRLRPYFLGGWGLYRLSGTQVVQTQTRVVDQLSLAMLGGLGFRYHLGDAQLFTEARLHGFTNGAGWGSAFMPVTIGIRF